MESIHQNPKKSLEICRKPVPKLKQNWNKVRIFETKSNHVRVEYRLFSMVRTTCRMLIFTYPSSDSRFCQVHSAISVQLKRERVRVRRITREKYWSALWEVALIIGLSEGNVCEKYVQWIRSETFLHIRDSMKLFSVSFLGLFKGVMSLGYCWFRSIPCFSQY